MAPTFVLRDDIAHARKRKLAVRLKFVTYVVKLAIPQLSPSDSPSDSQILTQAQANIIVVMAESRPKKCMRVCVSIVISSAADNTLH